MEMNTKKIFDENNIQYETQKTFPECYDNRCLPFDFYIPDLNMLLELQGEQHYKPVEHFGGQKSFEKIKKHDRIKDEFCSMYGYVFLKIDFNENLKQRIFEEIVCPLRKQGVTHYCCIWGYSGDTFYINDPASSSSSRAKGTKTEIMNTRKGFYLFWK